MYSTRTYNALILFSIAITLFMGFWTVWVSGGFSLFVLPMAIPFFIAPAIIYSLQLRRQNDKYALLLIPFVLYEFLYVIIKIAIFLGTHYGTHGSSPYSFASLREVSLLGFPVPNFFEGLYGIWNGPLSIFVLLLIVHSITVGTGYTRAAWKQYLLPVFLSFLVVLFAIISMLTSSSATKPQQWERFTSEACHYSMKGHPAIKPSFGDSFGYQSLANRDPYDCKDQFHYYSANQDAKINVYLYSNSYSTLQNWLLDGWTHASTLPFGSPGEPLIPHTDEQQYADKAPWKSYFKKEVEKLIPTGTALTVNGHEALEFQKSDTIVLFVSNPNKQVAELHCQGDGVIITTEICREMLHSFSFEK